MMRGCLTPLLIVREKNLDVGYFKCNRLMNLYSEIRRHRNNAKKFKYSPEEQNFIYFINPPPLYVVLIYIGTFLALYFSARIGHFDRFS